MRQILIDFFLITLGTIIVVIGLDALVIPYNLLTGGVTGIAVLLQYITNIDSYIFLIAINIPIFIIGIKEINKRFALYSIYALTLMSVLIPVFEDYVVMTNDILLASIFGGLLIGIGCGLVFRAGSSQGGFDIIAIIIKKKKGINIGEFMLLSNVVIILASAFMFNLELSMYTLISMAVTSKTIDLVQEGYNTRRTIMIVSGQYEEISGEIMKSFGRGVTLLEGSGGYSKHNSKIIHCVVNRFELPKLKNLVNRVDPSAFMTVTETKEVMGGSFVPTCKF